MFQLIVIGAMAHFLRKRKIRLSGGPAACWLQGATILGMSFQPSFAFRAADWLSIGGGPNVMVGFLRAKAGINTLNPRLGDGQVRYQIWTVNVGGNVGILLTPRDGTRIATLERAAEAYARMMRGEARFRIVLTTGQ